jgi:hypothetical protein
LAVVSGSGVLLERVTEEPPLGAEGSGTIADVHSVSRCLHGTVDFLR